MKFRIKIYYSTGSSMGSEDTVDYLEGEWTKLEVVEENCDRIRRHYEWYDEMNNRSWRRAGKPALPPPDCVQLWEYNDRNGSIKLLTDDGVEYLVSPFWTGCFEKLYEVEVVAELPKLNFR